MFRRPRVAAPRAATILDLGRLLSAAVGASIVYGGLRLGSDRNTVANTALVVGGGLVALGTLIPWFRLVRWRHGEIDIEHPEIGRARAAQGLAERQAESPIVLREGEDIAAARLYAARLALRAIYRDAASFVPSYERCEFRLFIYDARRRLLMAAFRPLDEEVPTRSWRPGEGATGFAFRDNEYVIAVGSQTHDATFNLDEAAQQAYAHLTEVAAMPLANGAGRTIGVLSVAHSTGETILDSEAGYRAHARVAAMVSRVVIDLLGLARDD